MVPNERYLLSSEVFLNMSQWKIYFDVLSSLKHNANTILMILNWFISLCKTLHQNTILVFFLKFCSGILQKFDMWQKKMFRYQTISKLHCLKQQIRYFYGFVGWLVLWLLLSSVWDGSAGLPRVAWDLDLSWQDASFLRRHPRFVYVVVEELEQGESPCEQFASLGLWPVC